MLLSGNCNHHILVLFPVIKRSPKYYTVTVNGRQQTVSIDRLKPALLRVQSHHCRALLLQTLHLHGQLAQAEPFAFLTDLLIDVSCS